MTRKKIIHLEDDFRYAEQVKTYLVREFKTLNVDLEVQRVATESDFLKWLETVSAHPDTKPDAVVMDVMVRWANTTPDAPEPPDEVLNNGYHRAGIRCAVKMGKALPGLPLVFLSITDANDHEEAFEELKNAGLSFRFQNKSENPVPFLVELKDVLMQPMGSP